VFLRILIVLNWVMARPDPDAAAGDAERAMDHAGVRPVAISRGGAGRVGPCDPSPCSAWSQCPLNYGILKRLLAMVETVRAGDPFVATNAQRLQAIAWMLLTVQILSIVIGAIGSPFRRPHIQ
jgi:hypothetical protein